MTVIGGADAGSGFTERDESGAETDDGGSEGRGRGDTAAGLVPT